MVAGDTEGAGELLCVGQGQQPAQGLPSLCPPAEDVNDIQAAGSQPAQQPGASAELVDGYQLHIIGDAIDAVQSPDCASAQVCSPPCGQRCAVLSMYHIDCASSICADAVKS